MQNQTPLPKPDAAEQDGGKGLDETLCSASSGDDAYGEVHVTLQDGRNIYWPKGDISRYAPAAVCQVTMRIKMLRKVMKNHEMSPELRRDMERLVVPLPYEAAWDSQCSLTVHNAIKRLGDEILSLPPCSPVCVMGDGGRPGREGCGQKAVAEMKCNLRNKWVPICGMHRSALLRRKSPSKPAEIRDLANA